MKIPCVCMNSCISKISFSLKHAVHLHTLEVGKQAHKFLSKGEGKGIPITTLSILIQYSRHFSHRQNLTTGKC